jgi:hypothetical protein
MCEVSDDARALGILMMSTLSLSGLFFIRAVTFQGTGWYFITCMAIGSVWGLVFLIAVIFSIKHCLTPVPQPLTPVRRARRPMPRRPLPHNLTPMPRDRTPAMPHTLTPMPRPLTPTPHPLTPMQHTLPAMPHDQEHDQEQDQEMV